MGAYQKALGNPNLEWQNGQIQFRIEINTFNNCLNFIADFYLEKHLICFLLSYRYLTDLPLTWKISVSVKIADRN